jgi:hypothetical protein
MNSETDDKEPDELLYGWYYKGEPEAVLEKGRQSEKQGMFPHYRVKVKSNIGAFIKIGILFVYEPRIKKWIHLREKNIQNDTLYKAKIQSLSKSNYLYIKGLGVWRVDGLSIDNISTVIQITRVNL